jgi:spermidine/putrescine transport system substrate-binding protein
MELKQGQGESNSSEFEKTVQAVAHGELTRRQFIERGLALGLSVTALGTVLGACGTDEASDGATPAAMDTSLPKEINIYNWSEYMSPQCLKDFQAKYGVKCNQTYYNSNEEMIAKLNAGATGYDVIFPTDMYVTVMQKSGLLLPLDMDYIPNFKYVTDPLFQKPSFDNPDDQDGKKYSVPYMFGTTGYCATLAKVPSPMDSWDQLWDAKYKGDISMLDSTRNTIGVGLLKLGCSFNTTSQEELDAALAVLIEQKPLVLKYDQANTRRSIVQGLALTHCWDGDVGLAIKTIPADSVEYVLPSQGYNVWADGIVIPKASENVYAAHLFLNHMLEPKQAGQAADYIGYQCVVAEGVNYITNPIQKSMRPTPEQLANGVFREDVGEFNAAYDEAWTTLRAA